MGSNGTSKANYDGALIYAGDLEGKITKVNLTQYGVEKNGIYYLYGNFRGINENTGNFLEMLEIVGIHGHNYLEHRVMMILQVTRMTVLILIDMEILF